MGNTKIRCAVYNGKDPETYLSIRSVHQQWMSDITRVSEVYQCMNVYVYDTVSIQTWVLYKRLFLELSFSMSGGVHNKLHISIADWWDILLPLA